MTMALSERQYELASLAKRVLPGGTFGNMASDVIVARGKAGRVWDVDGKEYVDWLIGSGPMLIGHAHPAVNDVVREKIKNGSTFFVNNVHGIRLASEIVDAMACAEQVSFASSGTEADAYAIRLARAHRKRDKILKFEGGYHGMSDWALMSMWPTRPNNSGRAVADTAGTPDHLLDDMLVCPFNDLAAAKEIIHAHRDELAGVIVEPMQRLVPPVPGFLEGLREITAEYGIVLIFDEVVTGFRLAYGGAQAYYGVTPDLCTLGKVIGGGYALSAVAGRADIMAHFDKEKVGAEGFTPQVGTLSGNPIAAAAGLATLAILKEPGAYERLFATGRALWQGIDGVLKEAGIPALVVGEPPMFDALLTSRSAVIDYRGMTDTDAATSRRLHAEVVKRGVLKSDAKVYVSLAHDERDVAHTIEAYREAAKVVRATA